MKYKILSNENYCYISFWKKMILIKMLALIKIKIEELKSFFLITKNTLIHQLGYLSKISILGIKILKTNYN